MEAKRQVGQFVPATIVTAFYLVYCLAVQNSVELCLSKSNGTKSVQRHYVAGEYMLDKPTS
jgi:hypothetical protein